ncbi:hypothetical protein AB4305_29890 [Nocardia sp. 2YAB30]|uniref:hypothetical protein n=1 Tax=Nocardia sp. 2YAB30 TaxID=3233022 RepID=UPI003F9D73F3
MSDTRRAKCLDNEVGDVAHPLGGGVVRDEGFGSQNGVESVDAEESAHVVADQTGLVSL